MSQRIQRALVTGGAGFIGSHLVDRLAVDGAEVVVYDNFSTGTDENLRRHRDNPRVRVERADVRDRAALTRAMAGADTVFHLQANADVRGGVRDTRVDLEQNTLATWNVLEAMRETGVRLIVFSSTAAVYGEPDRFPTPEDHPLIQTSLYGASKLSGEAMIQAYSEYFGIRSIIFRFVSWLGERYSHGVVFDFMNKLLRNGAELEILGNGRQQKSYLDVRDGVAGIFQAIAASGGAKNVYNLGHDDMIPVLRVAALVAEELGLRDVAFRTGGEARGWVGDSPVVHLDTRRIKALGWTPQVSVEDAVRGTARYLNANRAALARRV